MTTMAEFFSGRSTETISRELLGKLLSYESPKGLVSGYIVEA